MPDPSSTRTVDREDPWMTLGEVSEELKVHPSTVRLWVNAGRLAAVRAGGRKWRVRRSELDRMLKSDVSPAYTGEHTPPQTPANPHDGYQRPFPADQLIQAGNFGRDES